MTQKPQREPQSSKTETPNSPTPPADTGRRPFETFLPGLKGWEQAAVRAHGGWPAGFEISEADFSTARDAALGQVIK